MSVSSVTESPSVRPHVLTFKSPSVRPHVLTYKLFVLSWFRRARQDDLSVFLK